MFSSNKDRIYIGLYARGGQDPNTYHWALIVGPKNEVEGGKGMRFHARQRHDPKNPGQHLWHYEALDIPLVQTSMLLVRVMVGKVLDGPRLASVLEKVPLVQQDPRWTCRIWVRDAIAALEADGKCLGTRMTDWQKLEEASKAYVARKRQQKRYDGSGTWQPGAVPTYDLLEEKEVVP
jgi:hypothetical protein